MVLGLPIGRIERILIKSGTKIKSLCPKRFCGQASLVGTPGTIVSVLRWLRFEMLHKAEALLLALVLTGAGPSPSALAQAVDVVAIYAGFPDGGPPMAHAIAKMIIKDPKSARLIANLADHSSSAQHEAATEGIAEALVTLGTTNPDAMDEVLKVLIGPK